MYAMYAYLTKNINFSRGAEPTVDDVLGHAGVVPDIWLSHLEVVIMKISFK